MTGSLGRRRIWLWAAAGLVLFGAVGVASFLLPPSYVLAILATGAAALFWLVAPEAVILVLLLARSSIDGFMELFTLFPGSPLSMNLSGAVNSLAVGLGVLTLGRRLIRRSSACPGPPVQADRHRREPLLVSAPGRAYALFLLVCLLSVPVSVDAPASVKEWARLASGLAIYLMVADVVQDERGARRFVAAILASSLVPVAMAWLQWLTGAGYFFLGFVGTEYAYRPQGTFVHPGAFGSYLVIVLALGVGLYFSAPRCWQGILLAWAAVAAGCLALTLARAQWLGAMVAMLVVGLLKRRKLAFLAVVLAVILLAAVPLLRERLTASESVTWRLTLWQAARKLAWPPTPVGRGLATSPWHINQLLPKVESPPHNDYLKVLIETGVVGLVAYGLWLVTLLRHAWRAYRRAEARPIAWRALSLLAVVLAGMVMSLADNYLGYTSVQWYLWAVVALVPAAGCWCLSLPPSADPVKGTESDADPL